MDIMIREEQAADYGQVYRLHQAAFGGEAESRLVDLLRRSEEFIPALSLVAAKGDLVTGHILFTQIKINHDDAAYKALALAPMAVLPGFQRQGIGGALVEAGLAKARELKQGAVVVLGHPEYYPRFGFGPASHWGIACPFEAPDEAFLALELQASYLTDKSGMVVYPDAFHEV